MSQNIRVTSIVDRFLEHARIMHFHHGGDDLVFLSSADWMQRNLDKRIELLVPIDDAEARRRLIDILDTHFRDNVKARALRPDGRWIPVRELERSKGRSTGLVRSQLELWRQATDASGDRRQRTADPPAVDPLPTPPRPGRQRMNLPPDSLTLLVLRHAKASKDAVAIASPITIAR